MSRLDLLTIGETMVLLAPGPGERLAAGARLEVAPGGAESNVAMHCARLGHRAAWSGRLGDDALGRAVVEGIAQAGVDVELVGYDETRPTAVYFKSPLGARTEVLYYRAGSAATAMGPDWARRAAHTHPRAVHVSGITAALSASCLELLREVLQRKAFPDAIVSFDVNFRASLWREHPGDLLRELATAADVVFVGLDEARELWGVRTAEDIRGLLPGVGSVVVKDGDREAVEFLADNVIRVPALPVEVVEPVGAGDAFAAGWLSAMLDGWGPADRLAAGHHVAAAVLRSHTDQAELPTLGELRTLLNLAPEAELA